MKMQEWNVYLGGDLIDTVWYNDQFDSEYVYMTLVEHDGYHTDIVVEKT
jgi:hypothetical protein